VEENEEGEKRKDGGTWGEVDGSDE
jgi:hypothetical protein